MSFLIQERDALEVKVVVYIPISQYAGINGCCPLLDAASVTS